MEKNKERLYYLLKEHQVFQEEELEAYVHALVDIKESISKIYDKYLIDILTNIKSKDDLLDRLWDIREEFRHIDYHLKDGNLI